MPEMLEQVSPTPMDSIWRATRILFFINGILSMSVGVVGAVTMFALSCIEYADWIEWRKPSLTVGFNWAPQIATCFFFLVTAMGVTFIWAGRQAKSKLLKAARRGRSLALLNVAFFVAIGAVASIVQIDDMVHEPPSIAQWPGLLMTIGLSLTGVSLMGTTAWLSGKALRMTRLPTMGSDLDI